MYQDKQFEGLFSKRGQPAEAPGRLALATVLQFTEGFYDRQAAPGVQVPGEPGKSGFDRIAGSHEASFEG
jgi:hypothetical protein